MLKLLPPCGIIPYNQIAFIFFNHRIQKKSENSLTRMFNPTFVKIK